MGLMEDWQTWMTVGVVLIVFETFIPGFVIAGVGIACLVSALASYWGLGYGIQGLSLVGVTLLFFVTIRPVFVKFVYDSSGRTKTNTDALIGKTGRVTTRIDPHAGRGRVLVDGEDWRGVSEEPNIIEKNAAVEVVSVSGTKLIV
ncbi:MAG: NfeD family protein, partial [Nitrospiria bacterium]